METVHPQNKEQPSALKALKGAFEPKKSPYNPDFVDKIKEREKHVEKGKFTVLDPNKSVWEKLT